VIFGDTGQIQVNGAAANLVKVGDLIIIAGYAELAPDEIRQHRATIVHVDEKNQLKTVAATVVREP
jgi:aspartate 1-decarboxylase